MATNLKFKDGRYLYLEVGSGKESGDPALVGNIPGVCQYDADEENKAVIDTSGVYELEVIAKDHDSDAAISVGDVIYYDDGGGQNDEGDLTKDETNGTHFGYALEEVSEGDTEKIKVKIGY